MPPSKYAKEISSSMFCWGHKGKLYLVVERILPSSSKDKRRKLIYLTTSEFFHQMGEHHTEFLISIRDGSVHKDPLKILLTVQKSLKQGMLMGTNEYLLIKLDKITEQLKRIKDIKATVLSNIYHSLVFFVQSRFIFHDIPLPKPKEIPKQIKKHRKKFGFDTTGFDEKILEYTSEIITYYRKYNSGMFSEIEGKKLDVFARNLVLIKQTFGGSDE